MKHLNKNTLLLALALLLTLPTVCCVLLITQDEVEKYLESGEKIKLRDSIVTQKIGVVIALFIDIIKFIIL